jgi:signal transduction histidine kinase
MGVCLGLLATLAGCTIVSLLLAQNLAEPIRRMQLFAAKVGAGQFGERLMPRSTDEIGQLAAALNQMCERLDHTEEERRAFLAAASHELRTPATNIHVTLEALLAGAGDEPALRERFLKAALSESDRLSKLVRDLLDLARLEAEGVPKASGTVCLNDLVTQAKEVLSPRLRNCAVRIDSLGGTEVWVWGDRDRLLQVVLNLFDNAIRFSPADCWVQVRVRAAWPDVILTVEDSGPGIPAPDLPYIFDRFYTVDRSRARGRGGTGLGLAIARQIVEAHRGQIEAANVPGAGARFTVRLPRAPRPPSTEPA